MAQTPAAPQHYTVRLCLSTWPGGWPILVGRTEADHEVLRFRVARLNEKAWYGRRMPGSSVLLHRPPGAEPERQPLHRAAAIAAYYSRARATGVVAVGFTGARPERMATSALVLAEGEDVCEPVTSDTTVRWGDR
jgi:predicted ribosome quality control (RQC) complex YloA/Tae2 family protein